MAKSNTAAIVGKGVGVPGPSGPNEYVSVNTRKIDNGFITETCRSSGDEYSRKEIFSKEKPGVTIETPGATDQAAPTNNLRRAVDALKR